MIERDKLLNKLRVLRFQKFNSINNAAEHLNITPQKLSKLELGHSKFLDVYFLNELANAYGTTLTELLEDYQ